jgi:hypothetical protein
MAVTEHLPGVDHTDHARLTVSDLAAIEPDRRGVIDSQGEDGGLEC